MSILRSCLVILSFTFVAAPALAAQTISGEASVIDGDTIDVGATRIRLHGIDAPEQDQTCDHPTRGEWACGAAVTRALADWIGGQDLRCQRTDIDRYGRIVAICWRGDVDVDGALVAQGYAFAFKRYSDRYVPQERAALAAGRGLWTSVVLRPSDHRARQRAAGPSDPQPSGCAIKGNVSSDGKRIYHMPGQNLYDRTRISTRNGERWFCTEAEARMAGWRKSRR
jgi:endonuclease YncB( thermonuclease family)